MCGILGQINLKSTAKIDYKKFKESLDLQEHRGPDDSDILNEGKFIFVSKSNEK